MDYMFDIDHACKYGVNEAILIKNLQFWIIKNKAGNKHYHDNKWWTYNSIPAFAELFPFWSEPQIKRLLKSLIDQNIILVGNYNKTAYDHTNWYAFVDETAFLDRLVEGTKSSHQSGEIVPPIPDSKPDSKTDIDISPSLKTETSEDFDKFWQAYPKKVAKQAALKAFTKIKPDTDLLAKMLSAIEKFKKTESWTKESGKYIPNPATWLNGERWEDEIQKTVQQGKFQQFEPAPAAPLVRGADGLTARERARKLLEKQREDF